MGALVGVAGRVPCPLLGSVELSARHVARNETLDPSVRQPVVVTPATPAVENVKESKWQLTKVIVAIGAPYAK
jgi:hypothetical protein